MSDGGPNIRLMTALILVGTFVAGGATGIGLMAAFGHGRDGDRPPPAMLPLRELALTPEQETKADAIMEAHRAELDGIMRETFPRVRAVMEQVKAELRLVLTPEQAAKLEALEARGPPERGRHGGPGPGGPPGAPPGFGPGGPPPGFGGPHDGPRDGPHDGPPPRPNDRGDGPSGGPDGGTR